MSLATPVFAWSDLPTVRGDLPGTEGRIRVQPEDFRVTEIPAYLPQGGGSHLYLRVRKTGRTTRDLVVALREAGVPDARVGV
ncbi:MAG: tRNA pseudouridine(13) synthase TruD, partial [Trueperaceae bacterium]